MAMVTQFAQPGVTFINAFDRARDRVREERQNRQQTQAYENLLGGVEDPQMRQALEAVGPQAGSAAMLQNQFATAEAERRAQAARAQAGQEYMGDIGERFDASIDNIANALLQGDEDTMYATLEEALTLFDSDARARGVDLPEGREQEAAQLLLAEAQTRARQFQNDRGQVSMVNFGDEAYPYARDRGPVQYDRQTGRYSAAPGAGNSATDALAGAIGSLGANILEGRSARDRAAETATTSQQGVGTLLGTAREVSQAPEGAFGLRGQAANYASLVAPFLGEDVADQAAQVISGGADTEQIRALMTRTRAAAASIIPVITGDESGRYTDREQALARELADSMDTMQSRSGVMEAMSILTALRIADVNRNSINSRGRPTYELVSPEGQMNNEAINELGSSLSDAGFTDAQVERMLRETMSMLQGQYQMYGGGNGSND